MSGRILMIGEALVDIVDRLDGTRTEHPGGSPANVALGLGRLGRQPSLATRIGADSRGRTIEHLLSSAQVRLMPGSVTAGHTSTATATLDRDGVASYVFDIDFDLPQAIDLTDVDAVHIGSIGTFLQPGGDAVLRLVEQAAGTVTVSYDPNTRKGLMGAAEQARYRVERFVGLSDVIKVSDEDLAWLAPNHDPLEVAAEWLALGPAVVVVTRGNRGSVGLCANGRADCPTPQINVIDTVGAGDAFMSGLLDHLAGFDLLGADRRGALRALSTAQLTEMLAHASRAAAITCSRAGANPPTRAELDNWPALRTAPATTPESVPAL